MIREDELRETLDRAAGEIAQIQSNPRAWLSWVTYLLERMEGAASKGSSANKDSFMEMLSALRDALRNRSQTGGW